MGGWAADAGRGLAGFERLRAVFGEASRHLGGTYYDNEPVDCEECGGTGQDGEDDCEACGGRGDACLGESWNWKDVENALGRMTYPVAYGGRGGTSWGGGGQGILKADPYAMLKDSYVGRVEEVEGMAKPGLWFENHHHDGTDCYLVVDTDAETFEAAAGYDSYGLADGPTGAEAVADRMARLAGGEAVPDLD